MGEKAKKKETTDVEEMYKLLYAAMGEKEDGLKVLLRPKLEVYIKKDFVEQNREKFIAGIKNLNNALKAFNPAKTLKEGLSYINIAGCPGYHLEQRDVLILIAVGKVLGFWTIWPDPENKDGAFEIGTSGIFPMITGLKVKI